MGAMSAPVGMLIRDWRERRRMTQLELALEADVSTRHVSYLETGKARPSRDMIERLCKHLDVPLRERNALLVAAGFAPEFPERDFDDDAFASAREAIRKVLAAHEPYPALAVDRRWNLVDANRAVAPFFDGVPQSLAAPPVNVLRATLHPDGLAPRIANFGQWRTHLLQRVRRQIERTADRHLRDLLRELEGFPVPDRERQAYPADPLPLVVPFRLRTDHGLLSFLYTTTVFGSPLDVTLDEIAIESFFPLDRLTAEALHHIRGDVQVDGRGGP